MAEHGLTADEYQRLERMLERTPTFTELGVFSAMWSEHCGYKHSKPLFRHFPTTGPRVLTEAGAENAGAIDLGDGWCAVFKMESHNHPSAIEPYEGAATGVGGSSRSIARCQVAQASATEKPAPVTREFPAGSYIVRMDQPYSRIADALLDYQYWAPNDPQRNPYDDTGWTFPEAFGLQAVRVTDPKVLDVPMTAVTGAAMPAQTGATGAGSGVSISAA